MMEDFMKRMNQQREQEALLVAQREQEAILEHELTAQREQELLKQATQEKQVPSPYSIFHQLIEEICGTKASAEQKQKLEEIMLELLELCREKELYCVHDNIKDLIGMAMNTMLLLINLKSQRLDKEKQEVKNIVEQATKRRTRITESLQNFKVDYGFVSTLDAEERRRGSREVGYGIRDTWVDPAEAVPEIAPMTVGEVNTRVTELAELHEHDTQDLYALLEDAQDSRTRISQRVTMDSQRVDLLMGDRMTLQETVLIVEEEAYASREAWAHAIGLSQAVRHTTQHQVHETRSQMQQAEMAELRETDRRRQAQMIETLRVMRDMRREMGDMQAELLALREQRRRARQPAPDARVPDHQDASRDADSHI
ncbi:hypothetical protein Tco_1329764 [Tanacetum coccineum]